MQLFRSAIDEFELLEDRFIRLRQDLPLNKKHSASMNNLAVVMEFGSGVKRDVDKAKELYRRAVETDKNPIAMYNLAVLLKFEDPSAQNLEKAKSLFSAVADLGADLQSMPVLNGQLSKARDLAVEEISGVCTVDVDEIDDCLAYVKIVDGRL